MPATAASTVSDIFTRLMSQHLAGNDLKVAPVCTRVMLRTGVNLRSPRPDQEHDQALVGKVIACLSEMGYPLR